MMEVNKKIKDREGRKTGTQISPCDSDLGTKQRKLGAPRNNLTWGEEGHDSYKLLAFHSSSLPKVLHLSTTPTIPIEIKLKCPLI